MGGRTPVLAAACAAALIVVACAQASPRVLQPHAWVWPASGTITRPFGYDDMGFHPGVDIGMLRSLDVRAAAPGVVTATGYATGFDGYGNIVLVNVGGGVQTLYGHLSSVRARVGEHVVPGELLGIAGCTGICTGTHLHFEVRLDGKAINPLPYLPGGTPEAPAGPAAARRIDLGEAVRVLLSQLPQIGIADLLAPSATRARQPARPAARVLASVALERRLLP